jgi:hypothetical protein
MAKSVGSGGKASKKRAPKTKHASSIDDAAATFCLKLRQLASKSGLPEPVLHQLVLAEANVIATRNSRYSDQIDAELAAAHEQCGKPPYEYRKQPDGSWLRCRLQSDCTYAGCIPV